MADRRAGRRVNVAWAALVLLTAPIAAWASRRALSPSRKAAIAAAGLAVALAVAPTPLGHGLSAVLLAVPAGDALLGRDPLPGRGRWWLAAWIAAAWAFDVGWDAQWPLPARAADAIAASAAVVLLGYAAASASAGARVARAGLVVHSDDMGMTRAVTARIGAAWAAGQLDGFSVLGNGAALDEVRALLAAAPTRPARVVAHLNLCEGPSAAEPASIPLLVDGAGHLANGFGGLLARWLTGGAERRAALLAQVAREWDTQIARVAEACAPRPITAVDGHVHVHMLPFLFPIAARLAQARGIPEVRISREPFHLSPRWADHLEPGFAINVVKFAVLRVCAVFAAPIAANHGLSAPRALIGVLFSGRMTERAARAGVAAAAYPPGTGRIEVLFHVGRAEPEVDGAWSRDVGATAFQTSPQRDVERGELARFVAGVSDG